MLVAFQDRQDFLPAGRGPATKQRADFLLDTDCRLAFTGAVRQFLAQSPESFDPREYLGAARDAVRQESMRHMRAFGQAGHVGEYAPIGLEEMAASYRQLDSAAL
jgi:hypothetical protein